MSSSTPGRPSAPCRSRSGSPSATCPSRPARAGMVAPDDTTYAYLKGRPYAPKGAQWDKALAYWKTLPSDPDAGVDAAVGLEAGELAPMVTWGNSPEDAQPVTEIGRAH